MAKLTACILTKNEENNIASCINYLGFCDEILVIDDYSIDQTAEIAKKKGAKVYRRSLNNDFSSQRNFGLSKAQNEWVLFMDADERVSSKLADEIIEKTREEKYDAFKIKRDDIFFNKHLKFGETANLEFVRLARKSLGKWQRPVHEYWQVKGKLGSLQNKLLHYSHPTLESFIEKINFYTEIEAHYRKAKGDTASFAELLLYPTGKFLYNYFYRLGFLDGFVGFIMAIMMSLHSLILRVKIARQ